MVSFRRSFHKYPETGWTEFRTTAIIAERLNELGYEVLLGKAIINPDFVMGRSKTEVEAAQCKAVELGISKEAIGACQGYTGCAAILETGRPGPVTPWGKPAMGYKTRKTKNPTNKFIVKGRNAK